MNDSLGTAAPLLREVARTALLQGPAAKRRPVVVVGPEHSGTPLCAYALNLLGVKMTDPDTARPVAGIDGTLHESDWERRSVSEFHGRVLRLFDRSVTEPLYDFALPVAWWADPRIEAIRREMSAFVEDCGENGQFGFADPCTMRLLPLWQQVFNELKLSPKVILCLRNPATVARVLHGRCGFDRELAEYRWLVHLTDFFRYADRLEYRILEYEDWFDRPAANLDRAAEFLGLEWQQSETDRDLALANLIRLAGAAQEVHGPEPQQPLVRLFYKLTRGAIDGAGDRARRDQIVQQFVSFQQLQRPLERSLAANLAAAAEIAGERDRHLVSSDALGAELATTRLTLAQREAALGRAGSELQALHAALAERQQAAQALAQQLRDEQAALETTLQELRELDAARQSEQAESTARAQANSALQADTEAALAATRLALENSQRTGAEREAVVQSLRSEIAEQARTTPALQARLSETEAALIATQSERQGLQALVIAAREDIERAVKAGALRSEALEEELRSAEARRAALETGSQSEIVGLRAEVDRLQRDWQKGAAEAARLRQQMAGLRAELAGVEGQLAQQRADQAASEAEIEALGKALEAARRVGRAAMQALAAPAMPPPAAERVGWFRALGRQFRIVAQ